MVLEENAERGEAIMAGETGADRSIWQIIIGVFAGPSQAFEAFDKLPYRAPIVQKNPTTAAVLGFFLSPLGMAYVNRFWAAFAISLAVPATALVIVYQTGMMASTYIVYLAYAIGMSVWAFQRAQDPLAKISLLDKDLTLLLVITVILGIVVNFFLSAYNAQMQAQLISKSSTLPPEILDRMQQNAQNPNRISGGAIGAGGEVIFGAFIALMAWGIGSFVMGGDSKFKKVWGVTMLAGLIPIVGNLIKLPLMAAKNSMYVSFGLAALFPNKDFTSIFYSFLFFFDGFTIWCMIVAGIGYGIVFNISRGKGIATAVLVTFIAVVISIALMLVGMSFAGVKITFF